MFRSLATVFIPLSPALHCIGRNDVYSLYILCSSALSIDEISHTSLLPSIDATGS